MESHAISIVLWCLLGVFALAFVLHVMMLIDCIRYKVKKPTSRRSKRS